MERFSGGERARILIAQLMLQPADLLLLDEPTNDLDIPTLEISGREPAGISRRAGSGDARSVHAGSRVDGGAGPRWTAEARSDSPTIRNGMRGRMSAARRRALNFNSNRRTAPTPQRSTPLKPLLTRSRENFPTWKHANTRPSSRKLRYGTANCNCIARRWKTPQLPPTRRVWKKRWRMLPWPKDGSMNSICDGRRWKPS